MNRRDRPAANLQGLERWMTTWAAEQSMSPGRLRRPVGMMAIVAMIEQLNQPEPRFVFKGGAAFEFRFGLKARSSSDIDTIFRGNLDDAVGLLSAAIETGRSGFSGKVIDDGPFEVPGVPVPPRRATAKVTYRGKAFVSVPIEIAAPEANRSSRSTSPRSSRFTNSVLRDRQLSPRLGRRIRLHRSSTRARRLQVMVVRTTAPTTLRTGSCSTNSPSSPFPRPMPHVSRSSDSGRCTSGHRRPSSGHTGQRSGQDRRDRCVPGRRH
jgi:hypothetical protein